MEEEKELLQDENKVLKSSVQQLDQSMALLRQNFNDLEQYSRRECVEISGIPPSVWGEENVNNVVVKIAKLMDVEMGEEDISVCHRLPMSRHHDGQPNQQKIIVKFVSREIKEKFYKSRRRLSGKTTKDLGYEVENRIYLGESLTEKNKALFRLCLKFKKDNQCKYIWTSNGKIYLRKDNDCTAMWVKSDKDLETF